MDVDVVETTLKFLGAMLGAGCGTGGARKGMISTFAYCTVVQGIKGLQCMRVKSVKVITCTFLKVITLLCYCM